jgi:hypothetical protein
MYQIPTKLAPELEGMFAAQIGNLVRKGVDLIRADNLWKVMEGTQFGERREFDIRDAV